MKKLACFAFVLVSTAFASAGSKPVARLPVPCDSYFQVLSPDGSEVAWRCKDRSFRVLSVPEGKELRRIPDSPGVNSFAYSQDGQWLAIGFYDGSVEVAPSKSSAAGKRWNVSARRIDSLSFLAKGKVLVVGPADHPAQVWELAENPKLRASLPFEFGGMSACAVSPDGRLLVVASDDTVLRWYDTTTWQMVHENRQFLLETFAVSFTPDGMQVLAGGADARITVLDAATGRTVRQLAPEAGSYVVALDVFGKVPSAATLYLDDAGGKPPHGLLWDLASAKALPLASGSAPSCASVVAGKYWFCSVEGDTLNIVQNE